MTRLADTLRQGSILKRVMQPYESHMQYLAQWMCDYNLYGCAYIDCAKAKFRSPVPAFEDLNSTTHHWHDRSIDPQMVSDESILPKQSHCSIEVDICVQDILNRHEIKERPLHHDFIERLSPLRPDEKLVHSMAGLWKDETRRRKAKMGISDPSTSPFPPEVLVTVSADPRNSQKGGWIHEEEYREMIDELAKDERFKSDGRKMSFKNFVKQVPFEQLVKTALESVEDLYPENLPSVNEANRLSQGAHSEAGNLNEDISVDESRITSFDDDEQFYESDEELARQIELTQRSRVGHREEKQGSKEKQWADYDDETRPDGLNYKDQFQDSLDKTSVEAPKSSSELEDKGILRDDADGWDPEDSKFAFDIPPEYTSNIRDSIARSKREIAANQSDEPRKKKRKIIHDEDTTSSRSYSRLMTERSISSDGDIPGFIKQDSEHGLGLEDVEISPPGNVSGKSPSIGARKFNVLSEPPSQESLKPPGLGGNKTLSFPIVKDPNDPNTILRLSQQSASSQKSSQRSPNKQVSFALPPEDSNSQSSSLKTVGRSSSKGSPKTPLKSPRPILRTLPNLHSSLNVSRNARFLCCAEAPPTHSEVDMTMQEYGLPPVIYQDAFYGEEKDVPERQREYAGREFKLESGTVPYLPDFDPTGSSPASFGEKVAILVDHNAEERLYQTRRNTCKLKVWEIAETPPSFREVQMWVMAQKENDLFTDSRLTNINSIRRAPMSQVDGPTQKNKHGFKYSQKQESTSVQHETQYMSIMSLEVHVNTRGTFVPNPHEDEIAGIFWCIQTDDEDVEINTNKDGTRVGIVLLSDDGGMAHKVSQSIVAQVEEESTELDVINRIVDIVRQYDPDILTGYEVHNGSWGYLIERARTKYEFNLCDEFSRMKSQSHGRFGKDSDRWGFNHTSTIRVTGRHMINIWRAMRGELNLLQYTMENVVFHLLHRRIPHHTFRDLTTWYQSQKPRDLAKVLDYYLSRVQLDLDILESNELIPRTSEQARLLGVDFFSVFSRGSQFKVESLMFRIAKPENFMLVSPSRKQVGQQNALECLPLVMEPQSNFYSSPLLVLDFQSLYPSVMIAYNYCYSTLLGRAVNWRGQNKMGFTDFKRQPRLLELMKDQINIAPNGMMYVKPELRKSLLAKMLGEILETRVMVKSGMKVDKDDKTLQRLLNNRQLALKLIANVTYGYTSASFSGRMPCSEIADSIVQTGRETLEKAIALIHSVERWGAEVVYGDTDSLFVYLKGRTRDEAFDIGEEIAKRVTEMNPRPVKLKFEKVYHPCVLLAKKRYVGYKYESRKQTKPDFDAKGIETVRRDGTPAEQKIEEKALRVLFQTADLSQVKSYFQSQCSKIMRGKVSIQDFCFAKEVKLGTYSDKGLPPPGALISAKKMLEDPRAEPQYGERVPYVVITGAPGARLADRCVAPEVLLNDDHSELDAEYYISKNLIPPLERIFNLVGANVRQWYDEMPKVQRIRRVERPQLPVGGVGNSNDLATVKKTLESYMKSSVCLVCREKLDSDIPICADCLSQPQNSLFDLRARLIKAEQKASNLQKVCRSCMGIPFGDDVRCDSKDCPVFYTRTRHMASLGSIRAVTEPMIEALENEQVKDGALEW